MKKLLIIAIIATIATAAWAGNSLLLLGVGGSKHIESSPGPHYLLIDGSGHYLVIDGLSHKLRIDGAT